MTWRLEHGDALTTVLRKAEANDWPYIDSMRKREGDALGFIPKDAYLSVLSRAPVDGRARWAYQGLWLIEDNGDRTGYVYASFVWPLAKVFQIVVQEDARRWERATRLLDRVEISAVERGLQGVECRVAMDLEANAFWKALGYEPQGLVSSTWLNQREAVSKRMLVHYVKRFMGMLE